MDNRKALITALQSRGSMPMGKPMAAGMTALNPDQQRSLDAATLSTGGFSPTGFTGPRPGGYDQPQTQPQMPQGMQGLAFLPGTPTNMLTQQQLRDMPGGPQTMPPQMPQGMQRQIMPPQMPQGMGQMPQGMPPQMPQGMLPQGMLSQKPLGMMPQMPQGKQGMNQMPPQSTTTSNKVFDYFK